MRKIQTVATARTVVVYIDVEQECPSLCYGRGSVAFSQPTFTSMLVSENIWSTTTQIARQLSIKNTYALCVIVYVLEPA